MRSMSIQNSQTSRALLLVSMLIGVADMLDQLITALHPELHFLEWVACLMGAVGGQILFKANTPLRVIGGLFIGYMAGLYWGSEVGHFLNFQEPNAGRSLAACSVDMIGRCIEYGFRNPRESADFIIEKGMKILSFLGDDLIGKGFDKVTAFFGKKK